MVNGSIKIINDRTYVRLDGSAEGIYTPVAAGAVGKDGDRVTVLLQDHQATLVSNTSDPTAVIKSQEMGTVMDEFAANKITADYINTRLIESDAGKFNVLVTNILSAGKAQIDELITNNATVKGKLTADKLDAKTISTVLLSASEADIRELSGLYLQYSTADIEELISNNATVKGKMTADEVEAKIGSYGFVTTDGLAANVATLGYLKNDIGVFQNMMVDSGFIRNLRVWEDATITGELASVTVNANMITTGTLAVDRLLIRSDQSDPTSEFKMVTFDKSGNPVAADLPGSVIGKRTIAADKIVAGSITSTEINVSELFASRAFIDTLNSNQIVVGAHKTAQDAYDNSIKDIVAWYAKNTNMTTKPTSGWSKTMPTLSAGDCLWVKTVTSYNGSDKTPTESYSVTRMGNDGQPGERGKQGIGIITIDTFYLASSSNNNVSTATSGWTKKATEVTLTDNKPYLWSYQKSYYTDGSEEIIMPPSVIGAKGTPGSPGNQGNPGVSVGKVVPYYTTSAYNTGVKTSGYSWYTTPPTVSASKPYLWMYYNVYDANDKLLNTTSPVLMGSLGKDGADSTVPGPKGDAGISVTKIEDLWRTSSSATGMAIPTSVVTRSDDIQNTWTTATPTYNASYPFFYSCSQITYSNNTVSWSKPVLSYAYSSIATNADKAKKLAEDIKETMESLTALDKRGVTVIDGGKILSGSIDVNALKADIVFADLLKSGVIESNNYSRSKVTFNSDGTYSVTRTQGIRIDLTNGDIYTPEIDICDGNIISNTSGRIVLGLNNTSSVPNTATFGRDNENIDSTYSLISGYENTLMSSPGSMLDGILNIIRGSHYSFITGSNNSIAWSRVSTCIGYGNAITDNDAAEYGKISKQVRSGDRITDTNYMKQYNTAIGYLNSIFSGMNCVVIGQENTCEARRTYDSDTKESFPYDTILIGKRLRSTSGDSQVIIGSYNAINTGSTQWSNTHNQAIILAAGSTSNGKNALTVERSSGTINVLTDFHIRSNMYVHGLSKMANVPYLIGFKAYADGGQCYYLTTSELGTTHTHSYNQITAGGCVCHFYNTGTNSSADGYLPIGITQSALNSTYIKKVSNNRFQILRDGMYYVQARVWYKPNAVTQIGDFRYYINGVSQGNEAMSVCSANTNGMIWRLPMVRRFYKDEYIEVYHTGGGTHQARVQDFLINVILG